MEENLSIQTKTTRKKSKKWSPIDKRSTSMFGIKKQNEEKFDSIREFGIWSVSMHSLTNKNSSNQSNEYKKQITFLFLFSKFVRFLPFYKMVPLYSYWLNHILAFIEWVFFVFRSPALKKPYYTPLTKTEFKCSQLKKCAEQRLIRRTIWP